MGGLRAVLKGVRVAVLLAVFASGCSTPDTRDVVEAPASKLVDATAPTISAAPNSQPSPEPETGEEFGSVLVAPSVDLREAANLTVTVESDIARGDSSVRVISRLSIDHLSGQSLVNVFFFGDHWSDFSPLVSESDPGKLNRSTLNYAVDAGGQFLAQQIPSSWPGWHEASSKQFTLDPSVQIGGGLVTDPARLVAAAESLGEMLALVTAEPADDSSTDFYKGHLPTSALALWVPPAIAIAAQRAGVELAALEGTVEIRVGFRYSEVDFLEVDFASMLEELVERGVNLRIDHLTMSIDVRTVGGPPKFEWPSNDGSDRVFLRDLRLTEEQIDCTFEQRFAYDMEATLLAAVTCSGYANERIVVELLTTMTISLAADSQLDYSRAALRACAARLVTEVGFEDLTTSAIGGDVRDVLRPLAARCLVAVTPDLGVTGADVLEAVVAALGAPSITSIANFEADEDGSGTWVTVAPVPLVVVEEVAGSRVLAVLVVVSNPLTGIESDVVTAILAVLGSDLTGSDIGTDSHLISVGDEIRLCVSGASEGADLVLGFFEASLGCAPG